MKVRFAGGCKAVGEDICDGDCEGELGVETLVAARQTVRVRLRERVSLIVVQG